MKILQINKFFYLKGGPERYMFNLSELLKAKGHEIAFFSMKHEKNAPSEWDKYFVTSIDYNKKHNLIESFRIFKNTLYSREAEKNLSSLIDEFKPDIAHIHGFNHQLSPSILFALKNKNVPAVMTMHDYKLICPSYLMLNHGRTCELCRYRRFCNCLFTRCYRNSLSKCLLLTLESYLHHNILNSYRLISCFICPSRFIMDKAKGMELKGSFIHLSNFVDTLGLKLVKTQRENKFVYWGRLAREKGLYTLIDAIKGLRTELIIIGDGPLREDIEKRIVNEGIKNVRLSGHLDDRQLFGEICKCAAAVMPSEWYENNPISIIEAFALGIPVIGSRIGGIPELVKDNERGLLFEAGNSHDLRLKIERLVNDPNKIVEMGKNARAFVERELNSERYYERLIEIYNTAIKKKRQSSA